MSSFIKDFRHFPWYYLTSDKTKSFGDVFITTPKSNVEAKLTDSTFFIIELYYKLGLVHRYRKHLTSIEIHYFMTLSDLFMST